MTNRVAVFVDGKNFYEGLRATTSINKIDFKALSDYIVKTVNGTVLTGLHYYTGVERPNENSEEKSNLENFLNFLDNQPGCFVYRFARRTRNIKCNECGYEHFYTEEKEVDTSLVATMIRQAAINAFDFAVLCSGDADHTPALEALRDLGKPCWVATFGGHGLSRRLRSAAYGHIDLCEELNRYKKIEIDVAGALKEAEDYFGNDNYVGLNMFINTWRSERLPYDMKERHKAIQESIENGYIEIYDTHDSKKAVRSKNGIRYDDQEIIEAQEKSRV